MIHTVRSHIHVARIAGYASRVMATTDTSSHARAMNGHSVPSHNPKPCNTYLQSKGTNIFSVMTQLSIQHNSVNLGQVRHLEIYFAALCNRPVTPDCETGYLTNACCRGSQTRKVQ